MVKQVIGAKATVKQYNNQLKNIAAVGVGGYGVASPALIRFFMYGQIKRYKLARFKIKFLQVGHLYPKAPCIVRSIFYPDDFSGSPRFHMAKFTSKVQIWPGIAP